MIGYSRRVTHYCHEATCVGREGFLVLWARDRLEEPAFPLTDSCPHCGADMHDEPPSDEEDGE